MPNVFLFELVSPDGTITDVTERVDREELGGYSYGIEDNLLQFRSGDLTLTLDDSDGGMASLFAGADPTQAFKLRAARNDIKIFEGIVILPGSVKFSANNVSCEINAFGYLALLDQLSAETVARTYPVTTGSGTSGTSQLTLSPATTGLVKGDQLRISTAGTIQTVDQKSETVTINTVTSGTVVTLDATLGNTFAVGSPIEFLTPYYRNKTITFLVQQLFGAAIIPTPTIDLSGSAFLVPAGTPFNVDGLPANPVFRGFQAVTTGGVTKIRCRLNNAVEYEAADAASTWATVLLAARTGGTGAGDSHFLVDWAKYELTEPTTKTFQWHQYKTGTGVTLDKAHGLGVNHSLVPPRKYVLRVLDQTFYVAFVDWNAGTKDFVNGTTLILGLETIGGGPSAEDNVVISSDWDSANNRIWFCYGANSATNGGRFGFYDITGLSFTFIESSGAGSSTASMGQVCYSRAANILLRIKPDGLTLQGWRGSLQVFSVTLPSIGLRIQTMRFVQGRWVGILINLDRSKLLVADELFSAVQILDFSDASIVTQFPAEDWDDSNNIGTYGTQAFAMVQDQPVVIDTLYSGIVVYADFSGKTIAGALVELAKLTNTVAYVDQDYLGFFISRNSQIFAPMPQPVALDSLIITQEEDAVWEKWFGRVTVRSPAGEIVTLGDASLSASELDINSAFIPNLSVTAALSYAYKLFYSVPRRSRRLTIDDDETIYLPYQRVTIGAEEWAVYEIDYHWTDREIALRLIEAI